VPYRESGHAERSTPLPLLLLQGNNVPDDALLALRRSPRVQLFPAAELGPKAAAFSIRTARATVVATLRDPLAELVFVRTSGFRGPLVLAIDAKYADFVEQSAAAGVLNCLVMPVQPSALDRLIDLIATLPAATSSHPALELLLDAIDRTARRRGSVVRLSQREFALLHFLVQHGDRPVAVQEIHDYVWENQRDSGAREIVDVNISQLRKKLARIGLPGAIRTYRDFGYGLAGEGEE
jgi:DNA-binding winged helix-turn-helix (wHTH) protein